jgi:hypothetical protein
MSIEAEEMDRKTDDGPRYLRRLVRRLYDAEQYVDAVDEAIAVIEKYERLQFASHRLFVAAGKRMTADKPTGDERIEMLRAWKAVGDLVDLPNAEVSHGDRERQPDAHSTHTQP